MINDKVKISKSPTMSFLTRRALRSTLSLAPTFARASSSQPFPQPPAVAEEAPASEVLAKASVTDIAFSTPKRVLPFREGLRPTDMAANDPDRWWRAEELAKKIGSPGNNWSGRSMAVKPGGYTTAYMSIKRHMSRTGMAKDIKRAQTNEKKSEKRVRLKAERHKIRFQEEVSWSSARLTIDPEACRSCPDHTEAKVDRPVCIAWFRTSQNIHLY